MNRFAVFLLLLFGFIDLRAQRNVLVIMVDDFNHWISPVGYYEGAITPNVNVLASQGVLFRDASSPSPYCNPSRNAIWSGLRASSSGITDNPDGFIRQKPGLEDIVTMNQHFSDHGYYTYAGGKIYHPVRIGDPVTDPQHWAGFTTLGTGSPGGQLYSWKSDSSFNYFWGAGTFNVETAEDRRLARHFAQQISTYNRSEPFFFAVGFYRPHLPWICHKDFFDLYNPDTLKIPVGYLANDASDIHIPYNGKKEFAEVTGDNQWKNAIRAYLANLSFADSNVGIVLDALKASPFADSTIVVFMGDHGWHLGEKDRLSKHAVFDQASRTTFIIYDPLAPGNGQISAKVVSLQDVYPTLASLTGVAACAHVEGNDLTPLLNAPNDPSWDRPILMTFQGIDIIKTNEWRFIEGDSVSQLYHISIDPYEFTNLYGHSAYFQLVSMLRAQIAIMKNQGQEARDALCAPASSQATQPELKQVKVYPNPTTRVLQLEGLSRPAKYQVIDMQGSVVLQGRVSREIRVESLPAGTYLLQVNGYESVRFIRE